MPSIPDPALTVLARAGGADAAASVPSMPEPAAAAASQDLRLSFGLRSAPDPLPPELAFLAAQGVAGSLLGIAAAAAAAAGVTGEAALLGYGFADERYFRLLARHLGVPYLARPLPLDRDAVVGPLSRAGFAVLAPNAENLRALLAPRGEVLRGLLVAHAGDPGPYDFALTTPRRFEALLRHHDGDGLVERSASGLSGWDVALSARGGATPGQKAVALGAAAGLAFVTGAAPTGGWLALTILLFPLFAVAVAQRLLVIAASGRARGAVADARMPDHALPVYTLVVPLYREAGMLPQIVRNLDALDYPVLCSWLTSQYDQRVSYGQPKPRRP